MTDTAEPALLQTRVLTKTFGGLVAVDRLELAVRPGTVHSIIGPNGAGKTTVFNCIMAFFPISSGELWFDGHRIDGLMPDQVAEAGVNRTYQNIRLFKNMTAFENILVGMHMHLKSRGFMPAMGSSSISSLGLAASARPISRRRCSP